jgi:hypothetical protein
MMNFIALYRGRSIAEARLIAVSSEPEIIRRFFRELAGQNGSEEPGDVAESEPLRVVRCHEE